MNPKEQPDKEGEQPGSIYQDFPHLKGKCANCGSYLGKHRLKDDACPGIERGNFLKTKFNLQASPVVSEKSQDELWRLTKEQMIDIFRAGAGYALNQFKEPNAKQYFKDKFGIDL